MRVVLITALTLLSFTAVAGCGGGASETVVPYVTGVKEPLARTMLDEQGLRAQVERQQNDDSPKGFVIAQSPREGSRVGEGTVIELRVSLGDQ